MFTASKAFSITKLVESPNIAQMLDEDDRRKLGISVVEDYRKDLESRTDWDKRMAMAMKMALQVAEKKNWPWAGASNIKFPLITIAALQYHARAYPALVSGTDLVRCRALGPDPDGERTKRAERISAHMSYQLLEEDECWEVEHDKTLIVQAISGAFKKSYFCPRQRKNVSGLVLPRDLVVPYFTESLETSPRISHVFVMSDNDIYEMTARNLFLEGKKEAEPPRELTEQRAGVEERQGVRSGMEDMLPYEIIEQHLYLDLDGDGYAEPYIAVVRHRTGELLRLVARFFPSSMVYEGKKLVRINPVHMFTKYPFIPSPDGGFYDLALGALLGPLSASIDTTINQLVDAGTLANLGGGFLGRGVKVQGGKYSFTPGEWKKTDSPGASLKDNIVPLATPQPSDALFKLVELLIQYGERIIGSTEMNSGENPGQNTPAQTAQTMVGEGLRVMNGIYKRSYRAMKAEFRKLFELNRVFLGKNVDFENLSTGEVLDISLEDYEDGRYSIRPSADPEIMSQGTKVAQATALLEASKSGGGYNQYAVHKRLMKAWEIPNVEEILPDPKGPNKVPPPPPDPRIEVASLRAKTQMYKYQVDARLKALKMVKDAELTEAKIIQLKATATKLMAEAGDIAPGREMEAIRLQIEALESQEERLRSAAEFLRDLIPEQEEGTSGQTGNPADAGGVGGLEEAPGDEGAPPALGGGAPEPVGGVA